MPTWTPSVIWKGQDAFIIGGGSSLQGFEFSKLVGKNVIGCNDAFRLGVEIVPWCLFGDSSFWRTHHLMLEEYAKKGGQVVKPERFESSVALSNATHPGRIARRPCIGLELQHRGRSNQSGLHTGSETNLLARVRRRESSQHGQDALAQLSFQACAGRDL